MINKFRYKKPQQNNNKNKVAINNNAAKCAVAAAGEVVAVEDVKKVKSVEDNKTATGILDNKTKKEIKELFSQLQFSNETALPPDALRRALAESFFDQQRFQLGFMDDAAECFENMLLRIHMHIAHGEAEDMCNARHCIPHQKFAMTLVEQSVCGSCGATSEPLSYTQMVHYVSTSTLVYQVRNNASRSQNNMEPFGQLLRKAGSMGDVRVCPSACGAVIQIGRTLMNRPEIVSIGLVWNSERPTLEHIMEVFSTIGTTLRLSDVFNTVVDSRWAENCVHNLVGVVTYYGKHYSTFFFHTKLRVWIYFDDATVREVGPRWDQVVEKCRKGRYQPLLLLYASPDGTPVNTENAPKQVTPFYNDKPINKKPPTSQSMLRRSVTPSPEKPNIGNTRRAITPNPDCTAKPPLPRPYNDYQNLSVIQSNLYNNQPRGVDVVDGDMTKKDPEYVSRKSIAEGQKQQPNIHRTLSNGSSSGTEACFRDYLNVPRTRDSGNWSSDRNSASSSSSTTMENPYLYLVGKVHHENVGTAGIIPPRNDSSSSNSSGVYDVGYDSYSLSSNDSSTMTTIQHLMKMGHLAKIPEDYNTPPSQTSQSCDVLCDEADELLVKSRQLEDEHDLVLALALCNAAATKTRAAMDAPYNNPQTLTLARMKHNTCIMRARSLHRRMTQSQANLGKDAPPEIRHTREGSSGSGRHSRQSSRDKGQHSRQNSRELLLQHPLEKQQPNKSIEIYATLPKKKDGLKKVAINIDQDDEYALYDKPPGRETRSIFSRSKNKDAHKVREKRSRSEDRNKMTRDFSIAPDIVSGKETLKKEKVKEEKEEKKDKDGKPKKQHKIRRKLLMGGLIRRKNRSMPDLTDATADKERTVEKPTSTVDDSNVGLKGETSASMCGYLSEGHLEFTGNSTNPNLERSKLMRKSFHCSAGKILTVAKVPPPPPLRTTSQLSSSKLNSGEVCEDKSEMRPKYPTPFPNQQYYQNNQYNPYSIDVVSDYSNAPVSLPYMAQQPHQVMNSNYGSHYERDNNVRFHTPDSNVVVTRADVHQEKDHYVPNCNQPDDGVDEVDCLPSHVMGQNLELPPYPSPLGSAIHSRQASEEFPPPPPPLDLSALDEHLQKQNTPPPTPSPGSLLAQLQNKRQEILSQDSETKLNNMELSRTAGGDTWLKELQAKQAALRMKKSQNADNNAGSDVVNTQKYLPGEKEQSKVVSSVKDLATKFENIQVQPLEVNNMVVSNASVTRPLSADKNVYNQQIQLNKVDGGTTKREGIPAKQVAEEIREVEMVNAAVQRTLNARNDSVNEDYARKNKLTKKKSVSFCDQVILVATADEQEDDSYIPNPILERVLRSAMNKPEAAAIRQELLAKRQAEAAHQSQDICDETSQNHNLVEESPYGYHQPVYVRRNSVDNLLSRQNSAGSTGIASDPEGNYLSHADPNRQIYGTSPQHNSAALRQSPYQRIPQNSPVYNMYNNPPSSSNRPLMTASPNLVQNSSPHMNNAQYGKVQNGYMYPQEYSNPPRTAYTQQVPQMRKSPSPIQSNGCPNPQIHPIYQHPPSPSPSNLNSTYNYQQNLYSRQIPVSTCDNRVSQYSPCQGTPIPPEPTYSGNNLYQRPPVPPENGGYPPNYSPYQTVPASLYHSPDTNNPMQRPPDNYYQRVPPPHMDQDMMLNYQAQAPKYPVYQHVLPPKQLLKKTVSFEPGTKGGAESPTPKAVVTPIVVNNANNSVPTGKTKCNLCRKKAVVSSNLYCTDCEFYMSRFKPKR